MTHLVPMKCSIPIAGVNANASGFVGDLALLEEVLCGGKVVENFLLVFDGLLAVAFKGVGHGHGAIRRGFLFGFLGGVDRLLKILACFLTFAH